MAAPSPLAHRHWVLFLMALVSVLNMMDRQLLSTLIEPVKAELGASDFQMGILTGASFALLHAVATIPIALWADRGVRRDIISGGLFVWSALTALTGAAQGFASMLLVRVGVGIGEATGLAPAHSLLSDYFTAERRSTVLATLIATAQLGTMIALVGGGWLNEQIGWRGVFYVFGAIGLVVAPVIYMTVREPARGQMELDSPSVDAPDASPLSVRDSLGVLWADRTFRHLVLASGLNATGNYAVLSWGVPFLMRVHDMGTAQAGATLGLGFALPNAVGILLAGWLAGRLAQRDARWLAWMPAVACTIAAPVAWAFLLSTELVAARIALVFLALVNAMYLGPVYALAQNLSAPRVRASAAAIVTVLNTILGLGVGVPLIGWLNDVLAVDYGSAAIRYSLAGLVIVHLWGAAHLFLVGRRLPQDPAG